MQLCQSVKLYSQPWQNQYPRSIGQGVPGEGHRKYIGDISGYYVGRREQVWTSDRNV
jgi:hypothetical protein